MQNEVLKLDHDEEQLWDRSGGKLGSLLKEPHPKLTTAVRILLVVGVVGLAIALVLSDIAAVGQVQGSFPIIYYFVESESDMLWDSLFPACNTARTPGGDCNAFVRKYAGLVEYANSSGQFGGDARLLSTSSNILPSLPIHILSGLTFGAITGTPTLGVVLEPKYDRYMPGWKARHDFVEALNAALAFRIMTDAGFKTRLYADSLDGNTWCVADYIGGSAGKNRIGLPESCVASTCNWTNYNKNSKNETCFGAECKNNALKHMGWNSGLGFSRCNEDKASSWYYGVIAFFVFSLCISLAAMVLSMMLLNSALNTYRENGMHQLPATWPAFQRLAAAQQCSLQSIVERHASIIMYLECTTVGNPARRLRSFTHLPEGLQGVVTHLCFIIGTALPLHIFLYFSTYGTNAGIRWYHAVPKMLLVLYHIAQLLYTTGYYLRSLPFHLARGCLIALYNYLTLSMVCISLLVTYTQLLWTLSAIYYNQAYVLSLLTVFGSLAAFIVHVTSTIRRYVDLVKEKAEHMQASIHKSFVVLEGDASLIDSASKTGESFVTGLSGVAQRRAEQKHSDEHQSVTVEEMDATFETTTRGAVQRIRDDASIITLPDAVSDSDDSLEGTTSEVEKSKEGRDKARLLHDSSEVHPLRWAGMAERGVQELDVAEHDGEKMIKLLAALHISGKQLYRTLALSALLVFLSAIFVFYSAEQWHGGSSEGYGVTNLLTPLIILVSKVKSEGQLHKAASKHEEKI